MKILHILYQSTPNSAGSSIRSRDVVASQLSLGLKPIVITSPFQEPLVTGKKKEFIEGVTYYRTFSGESNEVVSEKRTGVFRQIRKAIRFFSFTVSIYKIAKKEKIDLLHAHAMFFCAFSSKIVSFLLKKPLLYEVRSLWEERYKGKNFFLNIIFGVITFIETSAMFFSNEVIAINKNLKYELKSRFLLRKKEIHIVENAVNLKRISINKSNRIDKVFAYIGTISPIEGLELLVNVFKNLHSRGIKNKLVFYGDGVMLSELKILAKGDDLIEFKGSFLQDNIAKVYSEIDIVINPRKKSFLTDSVTPLKPLEAMGYKKLIMASNIGGMREIIDHNSTGILFEPNSVESIESAILDVLNKNDVNSIVENAINYVKKKRSWQSNAVKYKLIYQSLLNE